MAKVQNGSTTLCQDCCYPLKLSINLIFGSVKRNLNGSVFQERKELTLKKLLPPLNLTVSEVAHSEGFSAKTLYHWRDVLRKVGQPVPGKINQ
jgi:hypothetical protein